MNAPTQSSAVNSIAPHEAADSPLTNGAQAASADGTGAGFVAPANSYELRAHLRDLPCAVCGLPLGPKLPRRGPRPKFHYKCGRVAAFLKAAIKALEELDHLQRMRARRMLIVAANGLPINSRRDARGRFASEPRS